MVVRLSRLSRKSHRQMYIHPNICSPLAMLVVPIIRVTPPAPVLFPVYLSVIRETHVTTR
jgi:hypothetical protein